ncbi:MAG: GNAT family N-acetyltransferase [Candidatus Lokiarchaeota archaeon]|nr:GNAT family N-acetyltransferase [Candidatus Lokiarchaeota archaeon]
MKNLIAHQIAEFINNYNKLKKRYSIEDILKVSDEYLYISKSHKLIGVVRLFMIEWYIGAIKHLSVDETLRKRGYGTKLIKMAIEKANKKNIRVLQSTVRENDIESIKCFEKNGFKRVNCFYNNKTNRNILIFQKILFPCR